MAFLLFRTEPRGPFAADQHVHLLALEPLALRGSGDLQYWRPSLYEFSRCFCIIFCFMLSNLSLETFRPSRRCRASPCSWVRYWNTSSAADSSIWPSSSVINSTSSCIESNCVRVMAAPSGRPPPTPLSG